MKFFTNKNVVQKIILALLIVILFNFAIPKPSYGGLLSWTASSLLKELTHLTLDIRRCCNGSYESFYVGN